MWLKKKSIKSKLGCKIFIIYRYLSDTILILFFYVPRGRKTNLFRYPREPIKRCICTRWMVFCPFSIKNKCLRWLHERNAVQSKRALNVYKLYWAVQSVKIELDGEMFLYHKSSCNCSWNTIYRYHVGFTVYKPTVNVAFNIDDLHTEHQPIWEQSRVK